jgi:twitching motility protein PilI
MAKKISLREFQQGLVSRIQNATEATVTSARLGVQAGPENWLLELTDASEVVPLPRLTPAPLTQPWFCGVANVRGNLYSVVDFSAYQGYESTPQNVDSRLLLVNNRYLSNSALLVSRMLGLRSVEDFTRLARAPDAKPWVAAEYRDKSGASWKQLDLRKLVEDPEFLQVGI